MTTSRARVAALLFLAMALPAAPAAAQDGAAVAAGDAHVEAVTVAYQNEDALAAQLRDEGYDHIAIPADRQLLDLAYACQGDADYRLDLDEQGAILKRERVGRCGGKESVAVRAPFTSVDVSDRKVDVRAPFADIRVDKDTGGVSVRAPFVDLKIGR